MCNWRATAGAAIFVSVITAPASAAPIGASKVMDLDRSVEKVRLVCDEFARCWQSQPRASQPYIYNPVYSGYGSVVRPPTKWERKGFCPPGQRKKGNC
jgi:hypothetical protein